MVDIEVKLRRLDEMRAQDVLQQLRVHVLVEDVHVPETAPAEARPCTHLGWMRILVDAIRRIERLASWSTNEHLAPEAFAPEDLLIGKLDTHPVVGGPILVPLCEGHSLPYLLRAEFLLMTSDTTKEADLHESTVDRT